MSKSIYVENHCITVKFVDSIDRLSIKGTDLYSVYKSFSYDKEQHWNTCIKISTEIYEIIAHYLRQNFEHAGLSYYSDYGVHTANTYVFTFAENHYFKGELICTDLETPSRREIRVLKKYAKIFA